EPTRPNRGKQSKRAPLLLNIAVLRRAQARYQRFCLGLEPGIASQPEWAVRHDATARVGLRYPVTNLRRCGSNLRGRIVAESYTGRKTPFVLNGIRKSACQPETLSTTPAYIVNGRGTNLRR